MLCQNFRFAGSDLQSTVNPLDIENKGMIRCIRGVNFDFVLPCPIRGNKAIVHQMLCIQTHCDRFFQRIVSPQIITALLEANRGIIAIVSGAVYASKSGGVVSAMLSVFQPFDGRMIDDLNGLAEIVLNFPLRKQRLLFSRLRNFLNAGEASVSGASRHFHIRKAVTNDPKNSWFSVMESSTESGKTISV